MLSAGPSIPKTKMHRVKPTFFYLFITIYELGPHTGHPFARVLVQFWPPTAAAKRLRASHLKALVVKEASDFFFRDVSQIIQALFLTTTTNAVLQSRWVFELRDRS